MKISILFLFLYFSTSLSAQNERGDIISKKIKSITTSYWTPDSSKKIEIKKYYSITGDDSLEYFSGKLSFSYKTIFAKNGKVEKLERHDAVDRVDEWHMYKYDKDGSYSIEVIAHGAGTIMLSKYDKYNKCLEQTFSSVETLHYEYDDFAKLKRILYNEKNDRPKEVAIVVYNNEGLVEKIIGKDNSTQTQSFKYNSSGLVQEKASVGLDENGKEKKQIIFYEYEYRG
jgi:hypothetical protein